MKFEIEKFNLKLRFVDSTDAEFILNLRTDEKLSAFLSKTSKSISDQINWIEAYKNREAKGLEYYFIAIDQNENRLGTTRLYNFQEDCFEIGSWLFSKEAPPTAAILSDILVRDFAFKKLQSSKCKFEVRKKNQKVLKYHFGYNPEIIAEDESNYYFELSMEKFSSYSSKLIKLLT